MNQTHKIAAAFAGGDPYPLRALAAALDTDVSSVYRWARDNGGTNGMVPTCSVPKVLAAAKRLGVVIPDFAWVP